MGNGWSRLTLIGGLAVVVTLAGCVSGGEASLGVVSSPAAASADFRPTGPTQVARVTRVTDGDTIRVVFEGVEYRVRYIGIDTPESVAPGQPVEPFALAASEANARLLIEGEVVLERDVSETDRFGRLLRHVWLAPPSPGGSASESPGSGENAGNGENADFGTWRLVSLELLRTGLAVVTTYPPDVKYVDMFLAAQREAREAGRDLWADD